MRFTGLLLVECALVIVSATSVFYDDDVGSRIPLVGLFHEEKSETELAFRLTVDRINLDKTLLPDTTLIAHSEHISSYDSFNATRTLCNLTKQSGIGGLVGPLSSQTQRVITSLTEAFNLPHIKITWDPSRTPSSSTLNVFPDPDLFGKALVAVIDDMDWDTFTIIYEDQESLIKLKELIKSRNRLSKDGHVPFTVWQLPEDGDYRPLLKEIQNTSESNIILDCSREKILLFMYQAKEVNMLQDYHSYVITSLDAHTLNYGDIAKSEANVTTLRLVNPLRHSVQAVIQDWVFQEAKRGRFLKLTPETLQTEAALMHDAVTLYAMALHSMTNNVSLTSLDCKSINKWHHGYEIIQFMKVLEYEGLSGKIRFNPATGRRNFFTLDITELMTNGGFRKIGSWDPVMGINLTRSKSEMEREKFQMISNLTFTVVSRLGEPYLRLKEGTLDQYEGYSMDLIEEISKDLGFKYNFYLVPDEQYGSYDRRTRQWNGLIRELRDRKAHLAICDLTITSDRRSAVDFSMPFMTLGISILFKKPAKPSSDLFSFLSPFSLGVWMCMATAYLGVSLVLFFLSRISPYEWDSPHPCNSDVEDLECNFSLLNCMWLATGSLMQQGSDILPMSISTRLVAGVWWFFILIMISSYTANLAAFLTMERMDVTIESVSDLAKQSKIKYGVLAGGSSSTFFRDSNESIYQKMWSVMEATRPSVFAKSNSEGVERVLKGNRLYAFFMESTSIEYQVEQNCDLIQVGGTLDSKGYGIAMPFNFPYRSLISGSILKMQESGRLRQLKNTWWKERHQKKAGACEDVSTGATTNTNELSLFNVGGMFLVLIGGCVIAFLFSILEFIWNVRKVAVQEKISPKEAFMLELKFAMRCHGTTKPIRKIKSEDDLPPLFTTEKLINQLNEY